MRIDGRAIANEVVETLSHARGEFGVLKLGVLMGEGDAASASFVKIKERVADRLQVVVVREFVHRATTPTEALRALERLARSTDGVIVQLPLPAQIDADHILAALPHDKDLDAVSMAPGPHLLHAPVAEALREVLLRAGVEPRGKRAVVVGAGRLVGGPAAELLRELGADVSVVTEHEGSLHDLKNADIAVLGAGNPGMVTPEMLKEGVVLIDAGTSEQGGKVQGDASPECEQRASVFTPVPGGVGPIAVAMIFKNLFQLARLQK